MAYERAQGRRYMYGRLLHLIEVSALEECPPQASSPGLELNHGLGNLGNVLECEQA